MASQQPTSAPSPRPLPLRPVNKQRILLLQQLKEEVTEYLQQILEIKRTPEEVMNSMLQKEAKGDQLLRLIEGLYALSDQELRRLSAGLLIELTYDSPENQVLIRNRFKGFKVQNGFISLNRMPLQLKAHLTRRPVEYEAMLSSIQVQLLEGKRFWMYPLQRPHEADTVEQTVESALDNVEEIEKNVELAERKETAERELKDQYPDPLHTFFGLFSPPVNNVTPTSFQASQSMMNHNKRVQGERKVEALRGASALNRPVAAHGQQRQKHENAQNLDLTTPENLMSPAPPSTESKGVSLERMFRSSTASKERISSGFKRYFGKSGRSKDFAHMPSVSLYSKMKEELEKPSFLAQFQQNMFPAAYSSFHSKKQSRMHENSTKLRSARKGSLQAGVEQTQQRKTHQRLKIGKILEMKQARGKKKSIPSNTGATPGVAEDGLRRHINHVYLKSFGRIQNFKLPLAESAAIREENGLKSEAGRKSSISPMSSARKQNAKKNYERKLITPLVLHRNEQHGQEVTIQPQSSQTQIRKKSPSNRHISAPPRRVVGTSYAHSANKSPRVEMVNKCWQNKRELEQMERRKTVDRRKNVKFPKINTTQYKEQTFGTPTPAEPENTQI